MQYTNKDVCSPSSFFGHFVLTPGTFIHIIMYMYMGGQATRGRSLPPEILGSWLEQNADGAFVIRTRKGHYPLQTESSFEEGKSS